VQVIRASNPNLNVSVAIRVYNVEGPHCVFGTERNF